MKREYDENDPNNAGRGIVNGVLAGIIMWAVIYGLYKMVF